MKIFIYGLFFGVIIGLVMGLTLGIIYKRLSCFTGCIEKTTVTGVDTIILKGMENLNYK